MKVEPLPLNFVSASPTDQWSFGFGDFQVRMRSPFNIVGVEVLINIEAITVGYQRGDGSSDYASFKGSR